MQDGFEFKNYRREGRLFTSRATIAALIVVLSLLGIMARMAYLQIHQHRHFTTLAQDNRVKLIPLAPTRGLIYDRNNRLLALNRPAYNLGNFLRRLCLPKAVKHWSLRSVQIKLIKIGA
ncbi:MAG TPA: hypothetical protein EYP90_04190, partial [Chromatiaceae bacterium]|nr:hypothetical protein [Chromatiaceae bacterium]